MKKFEIEVGNKQFVITLDKYAKQATKSVMVDYGDTSVLTTLVVGKDDENRNFFPLIINYEEKLYALGKIPGNYQRREGRPSDYATINARLIDRPIRPLFPEGYMNEIQIVSTVMSLDHDYEAVLAASLGASLCLSLADNVPFSGPIATVSVGKIEDQWILNPTMLEKQQSIVSLKVSGTLTGINMVESECDEISETEMVEGIMFAFENIKCMVEQQINIMDCLNVIKVPFVKNISQLEKYFNEYIIKNITILKKAVMQEEKARRAVLIDDFISCANIDDENISIFRKVLEENIQKIFRESVVIDKKRVDGRSLSELRKLTSEIDLLKRTHGSAMFTRGETQVLSITTLGVKSDAQILDNLEEISEKRFMLNYNFPPYSVGECGRMGAPGRREIGHGNLAESAISKMLPSEDEFPYTIRSVCEVLESNGSSSQASICSTSLSLMAAGVPLKKTVAGIAMGLIKEGENYTILTDIQGFEDHYGDMDFKVAGTKDGICAIQMDIKVDEINKNILVECLEQARVARLEIIDNMESVISTGRAELSEYAPKMIKLQIQVDQIKDVIGKGGDTINKIIDETNVKIDILEDGEVFIFGFDMKMLKRAEEIILQITKRYVVGDIFSAKVYRIESYGAFVKFDGTEGLLHISDISDKRIDKVEDVLKINDILKVKIKEVDNKGRIKVSNVRDE